MPFEVLVEEEIEEELAHLPKRFYEWWKRVEMLLTEEERVYFLALEEDFRRDAFIQAFWAARDPYDDTPYNEFQVHYDERVNEALSEYDTMIDARSQTLIRQGEPQIRCWHPKKEVEVWIYDEGPEFAALKNPDDLFPVLLYQPMWADLYQRWLPLLAEAKENENVAAPFQFRPKQRKRLPEGVAVQDWCSDGDISFAMRRISAAASLEGRSDPKTAYTVEIPEAPEEWVASFHSQTTILPDGAELFPAELDFAFPGRHQQRTVVQGILELDPQTLATFERDGEAYHQLLVLGEVVRDDELFERFRYRFEVPAPGSAETGPAEELALVFQRYLRPGELRLLLKVEDLFGRRYAHLDRTFEVPDVEGQAPSELLSALREDSELYRALAEADAATARGERTLQLLSPKSVVVTGMVRFQTVSVGDYDHVVFLLDEQPILSKRTPPYSVELDLGDIPSAHSLRVNGYDAEGHILATDEILINPGGQRFRVSLTEPQVGRHYDQSLRAAVQVAVPDGEELDRVELYLNEERVATLFQPPFVQPIVLAGDAVAYVRAVGHLADGNTAEDLVFVNSPGEIDQIDVHFVELYASVHDKSGRFVPDLGAENFRVVEDGVEQTARRFEWVQDLPLHVAFLLDVSVSMKDSIGEVGAAAQTFVEEVIEPKDRATLIAFNHRPDVRVRFTNDVTALTRELESLRPTGSTSLYDSLAFALHYFHGIKGQKALLLLSDGEDEASGFNIDDALEFARRAGVQIYAIGLKEAVSKGGARRVLKQFAEETGGRAFFVEDLSELHAIYAEIQNELRSQYLFAYQSTSSKDPAEFRRIEVAVEVDGKKQEVRTMSGYYP